MRFTLAVIAGLIAGAVANMLVVQLSSTLYSPPDGMEFSDINALRYFVATLPTVAFLLTLTAHGLGALVGGCVCVSVARRVCYPGVMGIGVFFLVGSAVKLSLIPHPTWFAIVDVLTYLPSTWPAA